MLDREQSAERLFVAALELPPEQRSAFLDKACPNAPELRRRVEALLADNDRAGSFLESPLLVPDNETNPSSVTATLCYCLGAGKRLGWHHVVRAARLGGEGG